MIAAAHDIANHREISEQLVIFICVSVMRIMAGRTVVQLLSGQPANAIEVERIEVRPLRRVP
jgi:hypothetical protein